MCGKFRCLKPWGASRDLAEAIGAASGEDGGAGEEETQTPGRWASVVHLAADGSRVVTPMLWGWPKFLGAERSKGMHIHARAEEIDMRPTWAEAFRLRRGMILATSFNEADELPGGKTRQWVCAPADGAGLRIGVIYQDSATSDGEVLTCFVMVTTAPCDALAAKNITRMPAVIAGADVPVWLGETGASPAAAKAVLRPYPGALIVEEETRVYPHTAPVQRRRKPGDDAQPGLF
ncbi:MAG: SOS response-associated peptidase family protein [Alphaproteobacteria bacterium]|nr:SOS response-associated peptidase family protein [Alphaproteobacteria bacterium]